MTFEASAPPTAAPMVDWEVAARTATRLVKPGPDISRAAAREAVSSLRDAAGRAEGYVRSVTGLDTPGGTAPVLVVDRPGWVQANVDAFAELTEPLQSKLRSKTSDHEQAGAPGRGLTAVGAKVSGAELGALLSYLAPKVLGQFDPYAPPVSSAPGSPAGRLLLVAPNIVHVERELDLEPHDFRLWVCLHEETHRVQFTAVPWLRDHLKSQVAALIGQADLDGSAVATMVRSIVRRGSEVLRSDSELSLIDVVQTPEQKVVIDEITAMMSLLEGHADVVMDSVGPHVVGSVAEIRRKFNVRRQGHGFDKVVRRLLGLEAKMRQYRDGARFCRHVIEQVGMDGFNRVWSAPSTLPTMAEIADPQAWVRRVHGPANEPASGGPAIS